MSKNKAQALKLLDILRSVEPEEERVLNAYLLGVAQTVHALKNHTSPFSVLADKIPQQMPVV